MGPSLLIQTKTSSREFSTTRGPHKRDFWVEKYVGEGFELKWLLLYLSKSVRVFLICGLRTQSQPCIRKVKAAYAGSSPHTQGAW